MAALCTGNYGLSQNNTDNSKEYFFVKLTDSAYRAVEEYQKNQSKSNTQATIQILGSGGVLSFPSQSGNGGQQFSFSIDDIEGSFECIQQTQNQLSVLGSLPYKMRIHANEDVYETTRHRMAVAEETKKNTCTREIKPNQTDIGRKVKLKNSSGRLTNIPPKRDLTNTSLSPLPSSVSNLNSMSSNINPLLNGTSSTISSSPTTSLNIQSSSNNLLIGGGGIGSSTISGTTGLLPITNTISSSASNNNINNNNNNNNNTTSSSSLKNSNSSNSLNSLSNTNINSNSSLKLHHHPHLNNHHQNYNSSTTNSGGIVGGGGGVSAASSLSSVLSSAAGSGTSGINSGYFSNNSSSNNNNNINNNNNSGLRNGTNVLGNNNSSSGSRRGAQISGGPIGSGNRNQRNGSSRHMPDITKKKIRERLIHLLALKPFKKPELYARLQNEGIREREKNLISGILKDISTMRDNTYNLKRQIWNDVNEDWPFYTEQELQMLKRRKPQNLTPPLSSDGGSSTSGQSPTSTHNGSPPPAVKRPSLDRERFYEEPTAKKQRISHFRKESNEINRRSGLTDSRDSSNMNPRSRENHDMRSSSYYGPNIIAPSKPQHHEPAEDNAMSISYAVLGSEAARRISPREEMMNSQHYSSNNHHSPNINNNSNKNISNNGNVGHHQSPTSYNNNNINTNNNISSNNHINGNNNNNNNNLNSDSRRKSSSPMTSSLIGSANAGIGASSPGAGSRTSNSNINNNNNNNINNNSSTMSSGGIADRGSAIIVNNNHNNINNNINQGSNSSRNINNNISNNINNNINNINGGPLTKISYDFSKFTKIKSIEQRRLYKTEFENDYDEYRQLLNKIENVRKRFNMLAERLHNARNNDANYRTIRRQILSEYEMINGEQEHQRAKARFDYLHAKLAHIKALVSEFDKTITAPNPNGDGTTNNNNSTNRRIQSSSTSSSSPIQNFSGNNLLNGGSGGGGGGVLDNNGRTNCHSPSQQSLKISPNRNGKLPSPLSGSGLIPSSSSSSSTNSHYLPKQENY